VEVERRAYPEAFAPRFASGILRTGRVLVAERRAAHLRRLSPREQDEFSGSGYRRAQRAVERAFLNERPVYHLRHLTVRTRRAQL